MKFYLWLSAAVAMTVSAAGANDKFELHGKSDPTPVSGYAGGWEDLRADGNYQGLGAIYWGEKGDEPCGLFIGTSHINRRTSPISKGDMQDKSAVKKYVFGAFEIKADTHEPIGFDRVGDTQYAKYIKLDCNGNQKGVSTQANDKYAYRLQVCTTDKRDSAENKLKGIRIWSRSLGYKDYKPGAEPILTSEPTPQEDSHRPHCDHWHKAVECGAGEIASGLRVHYNNEHHSMTGNERDTITGLALLCRKLRLKDTAELSDTPIAAPSVQDRAPMRVP